MLPIICRNSIYKIPFSSDEIDVNKIVKIDIQCV